VQIAEPALRLAAIIHRILSGNDVFFPKCLEELEEAFVGGLVDIEVELAALGDVCDDFERRSEVCVCVPG
jgi:hypothetical protein